MVGSNEHSRCGALTLFGDSKGWHSVDWTASDDTVRGGKSQSSLDCDDSSAHFYGSLDIKTLGGAGFASQRTTGDDLEWDLSGFAGIQLDIEKGDKKRYTFILKDELLPPNKESGREQSTISWECDFELPPQDKPGDAHDKTIFIPWESFNATYRGKLRKDADPIDLTKIKRFSIMMRSYFGIQEGDFSLYIKSISALCKAPSPNEDRAGIASNDPFDYHQLESGAAKDGQVRDYYSCNVDFRGVRAHRRLNRKVAHGLAIFAAILASYGLLRMYLWQ